MPNRIIREGILGSDPVNRLSVDAELFYRRLMSVVDDFGRFDGRPVLLRSSCYRLRVDSVTEDDVLKYLAECEENGLIRMYAQNGKSPTFAVLVHEIGKLLEQRGISLYLDYLNFRQKPRAQESKFPPPPPSNAGTPPGICITSTSHPHTACHASVPHTQGKGSANEPLKSTEAGTEAFSKADAITGGTEASQSPPEAAGWNNARGGTTGCWKTSYRGQPYPSPDKMDADYSRISLPKIESYEDLYAIQDPIVLAMAVTNDQAERSWKGWVKLAKQIRTRYGLDKADRSWIDEVSTFWGELNSGEQPNNPGAALTARLKRLLEAA